MGFIGGVRLGVHQEGGSAGGWAFEHAWGGRLHGCVVGCVVGRSCGYVGKCVGGSSRA